MKFTDIIEENRINKNINKISVAIKTKYSISPFRTEQTPSQKAVNNISNHLIKTKSNIKHISKNIPYIYAEIDISELKSLKLHPDILNVTIEQVFDLHEIKLLAINPSSPKIPLSEAINITNVTKLWNLELTGKNVKVAIVDTGIDKNHPMFLDKNNISKVIKEKAFGYNYCDDYAITDPTDIVGHGTFTASCVAGNSWDTIDGLLYGSAPDAKLINVNVVSISGNYTTTPPCKATGIESSVLTKGIEWLFTSETLGGGGGADIVSMSLGGGYPSEDNKLLIQTIINNGAIAIASIGNGGPGMRTAGYPGGLSEVFGIGSYALKTPNFNGACTFSSRGPGYNAIIKPDFLAPGGNVKRIYELEGTIGDDEYIIGASPYILDTRSYREARGTSFSCPIFSGIMACLRQKHNINKLYGLNQINNNEGHGLVNAEYLYNTLKLTSQNSISATKNIQINNKDPYIFKGTSDTWSANGVNIPTPYYINNKLLIYYSIAEFNNKGIGVLEYDNINNTYTDHGNVLNSTSIPGIVYYNNKYYAFYVYVDTNTYKTTFKRSESDDGILWSNEILLPDISPSESYRLSAINFNNNIILYTSDVNVNIFYHVYDIVSNTITKNGTSIHIPEFPLEPSYKFFIILAPYCYIENNKIIMIINGTTIKPWYLIKAESTDGKTFTITNIIEDTNYTDYNYLNGLCFGTYFDGKYYYSDGNVMDSMFNGKPPKIYIT